MPGIACITRSLYAPVMCYWGNEVFILFGKLSHACFMVFPNYYPGLTFSKTCKLSVPLARLSRSLKAYVTIGASGEHKVYHVIGVVNIRL